MPLDLNYHHLYYFWTCARSGRVTSAARELRLSQSTLSLQLKSLEAELGRRLFDRTRAGVELTLDGRLVFEHCEQIFARGAALSAALKKEGASQPTVIRLGVSSALGRETALAFVDRLSCVKKSMTTIFVGPYDAVRERFSQRRLDVAVTGSDIAPHLGPGFQSRRVGALPVNFWASPELAKRFRGFPRRGQEVPMLLRTRDSSIRREVENYLCQSGVLPVIVAESDDADLLSTLARRGRGVAALHRDAARHDIKRGALVRIGPAATGLDHEIWVTTSSREAPDPVLRAALASVVSL